MHQYVICIDPRARQVPAGEDTGN